MTTTNATEDYGQGTYDATVTELGQRYRQMVCRCGGNLETLATTMLQLGSAGRYGDQETLVCVLWVMLGWDKAMAVQDRYLDLAAKFGE